MDYALTINEETAVVGTYDEHMKAISELKISEEEKTMLAEGRSIGSKEDGTFMHLEKLPEPTPLEKLQARVAVLEKSAGITTDTPTEVSPAELVKP